MLDQTSIPTASEEERTAVGLARSEVYLFLSRSFVYPRRPLEEFHKRAVEAAALLSGDIQKMFTELEIPDLEEIEANYIRAFGHTMVRNCPLYETEYSKNHIFMQTHALADIGAFYKTFGVEAASGERLDHLGTELEFMYFLTYKEAYALASDKDKQAEICRQGESLFLEKHLGRWAPLCLRLIEQQTSGFYCQLARVTASWLKAEMKQLGANPSLLEEEALATCQAGDSFFQCMESEPSPCEEKT